MEVDNEGLAELERLRRVRGAAVLGSRAWDHACDEYHAALDAAYPHLITKLKEAKAELASVKLELDQVLHEREAYREDCASLKARIAALEEGLKPLKRLYENCGGNWSNHPEDFDVTILDGGHVSFDEARQANRLLHVSNRLINTTEG